jgi:ferredoxin
VGCGLCAEVCPRGVLRLENVWRRDPQELSMTSMVDESWKGDRTTVEARV